MVGIYGINGKYLSNIVSDGITWMSSALFVIPNMYEKETLLSTISCAIYHAIGLSILEECVQKKCILGDRLYQDGGVFLTIHNIIGMEKTEERKSALAKTLVHGFNTYYVNGVETYPYIKKKNYTDLKTELIGTLEINNKIFDISIYKKGDGIRFFQKKEGGVQKVENCDMVLIESICKSCSNAVIEEVCCLLEKNTDARI